MKSNHEYVSVRQLSYALSTAEPFQHVADAMGWEVDVHFSATDPDADYPVAIIHVISESADIRVAHIDISECSPVFDIYTPAGIKMLADYAINH